MLAKGPRRLLILDDVWTEEQLAAFPVAGRCARLVTTRNPSLAAGAVGAGQGRPDVAGAGAGAAAGRAAAAPAPPAVAAGCIARRAGGRCCCAWSTRSSPTRPGWSRTSPRLRRTCWAGCRRGGALQVDELTGAAGQQLDVSDPDQRNKAVRATIQASTSLLSPDERDRFAELAVFAEDETIPVTLIGIAVAGHRRPGRDGRRALCARLADLALLTLTPGSGGGRHHARRHPRLPARRARRRPAGTAARRSCWTPWRRACPAPRRPRPATARSPRGGSCPSRPGTCGST